MPVFPKWFTLFKVLSSLDRWLLLKEVVGKWGTDPTAFPAQAYLALMGMKDPHVASGLIKLASGKSLRCYLITEATVTVAYCRDSWGHQFLHLHQQA